jgi:hypothetical protein
MHHLLVHLLHLHTMPRASAAYQQLRNPSFGLSLSDLRLSMPTHPKRFHDAFLQGLQLLVQSHWAPDL